MFLTLLSQSSFIELFTGMTPLAIVFFVVGLLFCIIELFMPGFGFFGISGSALLVAGIVVRMVNGGNVAMLLYMLLILIVILVAFFIIISKSATKGKLSKTPFFNVKSSVPEDKTAGTKDYSYLVGKEGTALTILRPVGRVKFDNEIVDVIARDGFIDEGKQVVCVEVEGQRVTIIEKQ